jgi:aspartokinase/homoserine dehydrogenase 1
MSTGRTAKTLVMKFGGTSVGSPEALQNVARIVRNAQQDWQNLIVVVSAFSGVTDLLLKTAAEAVNGNAGEIGAAVNELYTRHDSMVDALIKTAERALAVKREVHGLISEFSSLCTAIATLGEATPRALDAIGSLGERMSVIVVAALLEEHGLRAAAVDARQIIETDNHFLSANPDFEATRQKAHAVLQPLLQEGIVAVVTGFIGATASGVTTTLGRGGSDYSAAILGAVLPADEVWIWTDVTGVMTADPRLVPQARTIPVLTMREVAELAYYGAKVLHPKTIRPVVEQGITLRVCNTFQPDQAGTYIVRERANHSHQVIQAVTAVRGLQLITVEGRGMLGVPGVAARTFASVARTGTSVPLITQASSEQSICFAVPQSSTAQVIRALEEEFTRELARQDIDRIWATDEVVIVTVVGEGMRNTPGVSGRVFGALGEKRLNVIAIAQGSSEVSISMVLDAKDTIPATRALHDLIVEG